MTRAERFEWVLEWFRKRMPDPETELHYENPYQLLVAVILSAQCTDKRVNQVTPALFERFPDPESLSRARFEELEPLIRSVSFANNKTRHLLGMASLIMEEFEGKIPQSQEELMRLPGVGRKTANVVTSVLYHQPNMPVDTHVFRVSQRIGLTRGARTPLETEKILVRHIPREEIHRAHHWLILHGRYVCKARRPLCEDCGLWPVCWHYQHRVNPGHSEPVPSPA